MNPTSRSNAGTNTIAPNIDSVTAILVSIDNEEIMAPSPVFEIVGHPWCTILESISNEKSAYGNLRYFTSLFLEHKCICHRVTHDRLLLWLTPPHLFIPKATLMGGYHPVLVEMLSEIFSQQTKRKSL